MGQAILEERKEEEARMETMKREAKAESSEETAWRNEASPDYNLARDEPLVRPKNLKYAPKLVSEEAVVGIGVTSEDTMPPGLQPGKG